MGALKTKRKKWTERRVTLKGSTTVTTFTGPGADFLVVIHGKTVPKKAGTRR
jgi:hypothetical protein